MDEARVWARTGRTFKGSGFNRCETGDCNGLLECQTYQSQANTLAEFTLNGFNNLNFIDISLVEGFHGSMEFDKRLKVRIIYVLTSMIHVFLYELMPVFGLNWFFSCYMCK
ncbi:putative Thaumatin family [Dioscorea sansibarensis]